MKQLLGIPTYQHNLSRNNICTATRVYFTLVQKYTDRFVDSATPGYEPAPIRCEG